MSCSYVEFYACTSDGARVQADTQKKVELFFMDLKLNEVIASAS